MHKKGFCTLETFFIECGLDVKLGKIFQVNFKRIQINRLRR